MLRHALCLVVYVITLRCLQALFVEKMTSHGRVRGYLHEALPGQHVERYFGIPYAAPPVGELRFEPPQPPAAWSGVRNATELPPACWQNKNYYVREHMPDFKGPYQEDCLYLSLYVPTGTHAQSQLPVLVHVHGGSNEAGMGAMLHCDVLALTGKMIVMNFNYRLAKLGFLGLGEEGFRGNFGLLDQVAALQWVKDNIHHFGGDPSHVTLQGHSAGGADVGLHVVSPLSRGLFRYAVLQSGFPFGYYAVEQAPYSARETTLQQAAQAGCRGGAVAVKECLKTLPVSNFEPRVSGHGTTIAFTPALVDHHFITGSAEDMFRNASQINGQAFLLGVTGDDGLFSELDVPNLDRFRLRDRVGLYLPPTDAVRHIPHVEDIVLHEYSPHGEPGQDENDTANLLAKGRLIGDSIFRAPGLRSAERLAETGRAVYFYSFDYDSPVSPGLGVPHGADLFYLFGCPFTGHPYFNYSEEDRDVSSELMTLWANFVTHGSPRTRQGTQLSPYTNATLAYFRVVAENGSATVREDHALRAHQVALWNELLPRLARTEPGNDHVVRIALIVTSAILGTLVAVLLVLLIVCVRRHWRMRTKDYRNCAQSEAEA